MDTILFFVHHGLTLLFGVILSGAFCGLRFGKKNVLMFLSLFVFCGILQLVILSLWGEDAVWKLYPLIAHLPLFLLLRFLFRKKTATVVASIALAYLCCQPSKWIGLLCQALLSSSAVVWSIRILVILLVGAAAIIFLSTCISEIFNKDSRSVLIFSCVPLVYYVFDYVAGVYTDLWNSHYRIMAEFLSFFLCLSFMSFCIVYYKEYEKKAEAERKEQILSIAAQQQAKEVAAIRQSNLETGLLRHDMRLLLSSLAISLENGDIKNARDMIASHIERIEATRLERFCSIDTLNYVLSDYAAKCTVQGIPFSFDIALEKLDVDEILFCSILSNALDNALNAQKMLPSDKRNIRLMLKHSGGKLLLSVKNPVARQVTFINGLPVSDKAGHGYGTQSIRYLTERLGGNCQFSQQKDTFILRVVL